ncbi:wee1-like protein kinase isoform X2 [Populus nigra]|uniref:wee1-like protein kinase isoform X2 n=1 Tax=Populus nigra TaxID=3691 RepID=UPI002B26E4A9|nr:wee1-like protein kinase isoform X2 [Populus nigra]
MMKRKTLTKRSYTKKNRRASSTTAKMKKGTLITHSQQVQHHQIQSSSATSAAAAAAAASSRFQNVLDSDLIDPQLLAEDVDEKDFILSQDFFCTPDYITPDNQNLLYSFDCNKENIPCPKSPEKVNTVISKKLRQVHPLSPTLSDQQPIVDIGKDNISAEEMLIVKPSTLETKKPQNYVSQSAVFLRCQVMPPPCIKNPYLTDASEVGIDPFGNQRSKCAGFFAAFAGGDGLSRYHTDFHEIQQIGTGNFSCVFKVLKRIDGCLYAVKHSTRQLHQDAERRKALMEVQALAALGYHENIVGYYSSWFENEQLYIQMELCDGSLSINRSSESITEGEALQVLLQIAKALKFIHERGIAHLDVKPDNIYFKNGVYKLGDFGCATLLDQSLPVEEGDARYMPQEILNENYNYLDKVDIFSLGAAIYELIRGSILPQSGTHLFNLREGKLPLLPGHSLQLQNLLKAGWVGYSPNLAKLSSCLQTFMEMGPNCLEGGILKEKKWYLMTMFSFTVLFKYVVQNGSLTIYLLLYLISLVRIVPV